MSPLQSIPANVRTTLYWVGYVAGVLGQGITLVWGAVAAASPDVAMPLALVIASAVLGLLQTQLNLLAGSNVSDPNTVTTQAPPESTVTTEVDIPNPAVHITGDVSGYVEKMSRAAGSGDSDPHRY
jgi:hypothetical protein